MNYGFLEGVKDASHYVLGWNSKVPNLVLQPDGQWDKYLPKYEIQNENFETAGCPVWGWQNIIEILMDRLYGQKPNYSERFTYIRAGVTLNGASPHDVAECIRKEGLLPAQDLPNNTSTYEEFKDPRVINAKLLVKAQNWLYRYAFMHDWLWYDYVDKDRRTFLLKEGLKYSPIGVSVSAWHKENGVYVDKGLPNTHWCVVYGWNKKGWKVFDSYDHTRKILSFDHNIKIAKRAYIAPAKNKNWLIELIISFKKLFV